MRSPLENSSSRVEILKQHVCDVVNLDIGPLDVAGVNNCGNNVGNSIQAEYALLQESHWMMFKKAVISWASE
jgi:hypothetical protein